MKSMMKYILASFWLLFTLSFAAWWMYFVLVQLSHLEALLPGPSLELARYRRMMLWEGGAWMVLLLAGGVTLLFLVARQARVSRELKEFFASFSHDVKTSLSSLRLQAESLKEDLLGQDLPVLDRLVSDTVRLQLQLENSLFLSSSEDVKLYMEDLYLSKIMASLRQQWPQINIELKGAGQVKADERALLSIFSNLLQNALVHGMATKFILEISKAQDSCYGCDGLSNKIKIVFYDNGVGFQGNYKKLAQLFYRHTPGSGSGVGLHISQQLAVSMGGLLQFESDSCGQGFGGMLILEGHVL